MQFRVLTEAEYADFCKSAPRLFISQTPQYAAVKRAQGFPVEYLGVLENDQVVGAALVVYQPWKRIFRRALVTYGPTLDWERPDLVRFFCTQLTAYLRRKPRVLAWRCNPILAQNFYTDTTLLHSNPQADTFAQVMAELRAVNQAQAAGEDKSGAGLQERFIYTKNVAGLDFAAATATLAKGLRRRFHNEGRYGMEVRFLPPEDWQVLESLHDSTADRTTMDSHSAYLQDYYPRLMREFGSEQAFLCVSFFSPKRYLAQLAADAIAATERQNLLQERPATKNRDRELNELETKLAKIDTDRQELQKFMGSLGIDLNDPALNIDNLEFPTNSAVGFIVGKELILLIGGMDKRFAAYNRDYAVEREMFKLCCDRNLDIYNTFGIDGDFSADSDFASVLAFKRWLCGNVEEFVGTFGVPVRPLLARILGAL